MATASAKPAPFPTLIAARERGMAANLLFALGSVGLGAWIVKRSAAEASWIYQFLFERSIVQAVLMVVFATGFIHLCRRLPAYWREQRALVWANNSPARGAVDTLVGRRRRNIAAAIGPAAQRGNLVDYARSLAEHDAAEVDASYRVPSDIVQVLPLIGFFGTVLGLSIGLYSSYLVDGGTTSQGFAKAIALAFDNTLLGLLLTILLFVGQSVMRKREDALLLRLDLESAEAISAHVPTGRTPADADRLAAAMRDLAEAMAVQTGELARTRKALELPSEALMAVLAETVARGAAAVAETMGSAADRAIATWEPACGQLKSIDEGVWGIAANLQSLQTQIDEHAARAEQAVHRELSAQTESIRSELRRPRKMTLVEGPLAESGVERG